MWQLTIRGSDDSLERRLRELAAEKGISLNRAALALMRRGAGLDGDASPAAGRVGSSLDTFIGVWSREDEEELLEAITPFERVDPELWS